jgi:hypothetical protein
MLRLWFQIAAWEKYFSSGWAVDASEKARCFEFNLNKFIHACKNNQNKLLNFVPFPQVTKKSIFNCPVNALGSTRSELSIFQVLLSLLFFFLIIIIFYYLSVLPEKKETLLIFKNLLFHLGLDSLFTWFSRKIFSDFVQGSLRRQLNTDARAKGLKRLPLSLISKQNIFTTFKNKTPRWR